MNIYRVISETLTDIICEDWFNQACHEEPYCIVEFVAARNPSQAKYIAWKTNDDFSYDFRDMPKFSVNLCVKDIDIKSGIVTSNKRFQDCWSDEEE